MDLFPYLPCPKALRTDGWCRFCNGYLCGLGPCTLSVDDEKKETVEIPYKISINVMLFGYKFFHSDKKPLEFLVTLDHIGRVIEYASKNIDDYGSPLTSTDLGLDHDDSSFVFSIYSFRSFYSV